MYTFKLFYGVQNGGDGSAYPHFFDSLELADWDQEHMYEGWGENCTGTIEFESESPIICKEKIYDKITYFFECVNEGEEDEYLEDFFPDGFPANFIVEAEKKEYYPGYVMNNVYLNGKFITAIHSKIEDSGLVLQTKINSLDDFKT